VQCTDGAVVTSGSYERGFQWQGKRYHHILDPRSCWPVENGLVSATVLAPDAALADALATAVLVLGAKDGFALAQRYGAQLVLLDDSNQVYYSKTAPLELLDTTTTITATIPLV
jgi:thiamine biosynthesis lipoprotein